MKKKKLTHKTTSKLTYKSTSTQVACNQVITSDRFENLENKELAI